MSTVDAGLSQQELATIARNFATEPDMWIARLRLNTEGRWYEQIYAREGYDVWLISWLPGQATGFHDHGFSAGAFAVAWGALEEHRDGTVSTITAGTARSFGPNFVHDVRNASAAPAVSVHAYAPTLAEMTRYEVTADGLVARGTETARDW